MMQNRKLFVNVRFFSDTFLIHSEAFRMIRLATLVILRFGNNFHIYKAENRKLMNSWLVI